MFKTKLRIEIINKYEYLINNDINNKILKVD